MNALTILFFTIGGSGWVFGLLALARHLPARRRFAAAEEPVEVSAADSMPPRMMTVVARIEMDSQGPRNSVLEHPRIRALRSE